VRFAFITPRYGADITRGPEHAARLFAEHLSLRHDVDVLTTCAADSPATRNAYLEGSDRVRGVLVRRFSITGGHDPSALERLSRRVFSGGHSRADEIEWMKRAGPWSPGLIDFLKRANRNYDALVFFSARHATSVLGVEIAPERSMLFPWLQLEPSLRLQAGIDAITTVAAIAYVSPAERRLMHAHACVSPAAEEIVGVGVQPPAQLSYPRLSPEQDGDAEHDVETDATELEDEWAKPHLEGKGAPFRRRHRLDGRLVVHGGRVEPGNGCEELLDYFDTFAAGDGAAALVLLGVKMMKVPEAPYLRLAGVLPARERMSAFEAADITAAPEPDDLLAEPVLESFAAGTPVIASARNMAAVEHCRRANAGLYYANREEFVGALRLLVTNDRLREALGRNGQHYVQQHYRWDAVVGRFERLLTRMRQTA
jgi:glycosyltransferase involved in cell wall biosynthesis